MLETTKLPTLEALTFQTAAVALERGRAAIRAGQTVFDLNSVRVADSSGVAVLLAMQRSARKAGVSLSFVNLPVSLRSLATLYGVEGLLADAPADPHHH